MFAYKIKSLILKKIEMSSCEWARKMIFFLKTLILYFGFNFGVHISLYYKIILSALKRSGKFEEKLKCKTIAGAV